MFNSFCLSFRSYQILWFFVIAKKNDFSIFSSHDIYLVFTFIFESLEDLLTIFSSSFNYANQLINVSIIHSIISISTFSIYSEIDILLIWAVDLIWNDFKLLFISFSQASKFRKIFSILMFFSCWMIFFDFQLFHINGNSFLYLLPDAYWLVYY